MRIVLAPKVAKVIGSGDERGGNGDFGLEKFGNGTAGFGGFHGRVEFCLVRAGNFGDKVEMAFGDGEALAHFFKRDRGCGFKFVCDKAGASELS